MKKQFITYDEINYIKLIAESKILSMQEKAERMYNIISYDDLMDMCGFCNTLNVNLIEDEKFKPLGDVRFIYMMFNAWGLFKPYENKAKLLKLENK